jgi:hypothetical protein
MIGTPHENANLAAVMVRGTPLLSLMLFTACELHKTNAGRLDLAGARNRAMQMENQGFRLQKEQFLDSLCFVQAREDAFCNLKLDRKHFVHGGSASMTSQIWRKSEHRSE